MNGRRSFHLARLVSWPLALMSIVLPLMAAGSEQDAGMAAAPSDQAPSDQWVRVGFEWNNVPVIAIDPSNPATVYATAASLYKSTDGGATWNNLSIPAQAVAINPSNPNIVYAGSDYRIMKSLDGGNSWFLLPGPDATHAAIVIDPQHTNTVYDGAGFGYGVQKTTNGGASWSESLTSQWATELAIDPINPQNLFAATRDYGLSSSVNGVWRTNDGGVQWTLVLTDTEVRALALDPAHSGTLYAGTRDNGVLKSTDGGASWLPSNNGLTYPIVQALAIDPQNTNVIYAGTWEGGVFRSTDGGASWSQLNAGLTNTYVLSLAVDPGDARVVYAGTEGGGLFKWVAPPPPDPSSTYAHVVDAGEQPMAGAQIYLNGNLVTDSRGAARLTDSAGNLILQGVQSGDTLVALSQQETRSTARAGHDGWAYKVYTSNLRVAPDGSLLSFRVVNPIGPQTMVVKPEHPLVLFNLVVSIEWDADQGYIDQIARAVKSASDYLYDMTDGQMAFGQVAIYDYKDNWAHADIQISTNNIVRPHAQIGGITAADLSHTIRIGRFWDGRTGNQGAWDALDGYSTLAHEFGHYALHLYDEYIYYIFDQHGNLVREQPAACTGNHDLATADSNASVMDEQYTSTELAMRDVPGLWSNLCTRTVQWQFNGESDWETVMRKYADTRTPPRWRFTTPADRGAVLDGPQRLPTDVLNLPLVTKQLGGATGFVYHLTVYGSDGAGHRNAIVALYKDADGRIIGQGMTVEGGRLDIYGATPGDKVRAMSFDGGQWGQVEIQAGATDVALHMEAATGLSTQSVSSIPHLRVVAEPGGTSEQIDLKVFLIGFGAGANPGVIVTVPGDERGESPQMSYSAASGIYEGQISLSSTTLGMGRVQALGEVGNRVLQMQSAYRLQRTLNGQRNKIFSNDGNLELHLEPGSLLDSQTYVVVAPPGAIPGPLPAGMTLVGDPYDLTASGASAKLEKPGVLTLRYDAALTRQAVLPTNLALYWWRPDPTGGTWQPVTGTLDAQHRTISATIEDLGIYALLAPGVGSGPPPRQIFLPIARK